MNNLHFREKNESNEFAPYIDLFNNFLNEVEEIIKKDLSDNVRNKNLNMFLTFLKISDSLNFIKELHKKVIVIKEVKVWLMDIPLKNFSSKILSWEVLLLPVVTIKDWELWYDAIVLYIKKDDFSSFKEKIKSFIDSILPKPKLKYN